MKEGDNEEEGAVGGASTSSATGFSGPCDVYEGENLVPMVKTVCIFSLLLQKYTLGGLIKMKHLDL